MDNQQILTNLNFGKVDAETDDRLLNCFIGTDLLKYVLQPQHILLLGGKGSGKSAIFRLLYQESKRLAYLIPSNYKEIIRVPAYALNSDFFLSHSEVRDINPQNVDEFKYFWQLYFALKAAKEVLQSSYINSFVKKNKSRGLQESFLHLKNIISRLGLLNTNERFSDKVINNLKELLRFHGGSKSEQTIQKSSINATSLLSLLDRILKESDSLIWILIDQVDLMYLDNPILRKKAITALIQLLNEYSNRYSNINLKIFLRTDIYNDLQIVNKSHLISKIVELNWNESLIMRLMIARAIYDKNIRSFCENALKENLDISKIISANDELLLKVYYTIFQKETRRDGFLLHRWMMKKMLDGHGKLYPREFIHLGNQAVQIQKEMNKNKPQSGYYLISVQAVLSAFKNVSKYRCDTYLNAEFPHLLQHFKRLSENKKSVLLKEELLNLYSDLNLSGMDAISALYDTGILKPIGADNPNVAKKFKIPDLYRYGLGITKGKKVSVI